jgi:hypothetical protein
MLNLENLFFTLMLAPFNPTSCRRPVLICSHWQEIPFDEAAHRVVIKSNVVPLVFRPLGWVWESTNNGAKVAVLGMISHKANSGATRQVGNVF